MFFYKNYSQGRTRSRARRRAGRGHPLPQPGRVPPGSRRRARASQGYLGVLADLAMPGDLADLERATARNVVTRSLKVRPGESVMIESWSHTLPLASAIVDEARRVGGIPLLLLEDETAYWNAVDRKQTRLLGRMSRSEQAAVRAADVFVMFWGPGDSQRFEQLDAKASDEVTAWNDPWYALARTSHLRGLRMGFGFATESNARLWGTTVERARREILAASGVDPALLAKAGSRLRRSLQGRRRLRIRHANGTDLELRLAGRPGELSTGVPGRSTPRRPYGMLTGLPDGKFAIPLEGSTAEGTLLANLPTWTPWWRHAGGRWDFHEGRLTEFSFDQGGEKFRQRFGEGTAGKDRPGALQFGLNPALRSIPTMHTSQGGVVSLQVGRNIGFGGTNRSTFLDWVSLAGADVTVDGSPLLRGGRFL